MISAVISVQMFVKNCFVLLSIFVLIKIGLCSWRIRLGKDQLSLEYYLGIIEWKKEFLKIAFLALLAIILSFIGA